MQVIVKHGAIDRHQMEKDVAKPAALGILQGAVRNETMKSTDKWFRARVDPVEAAKNARNLKRNLDRVCPETLNPAVKDMMWRRAKALKDEFVVGMLSKEDLHPVKGFMENGTMKWVVDEGAMNSSRSTERNTAWLRKNEPKIREFKNLMRHLCPQDPNAGDIEKFRPKRRVA